MTDMLPELIIPAGTQVVTRAEIRDAGGRIIRPRGAVGIIVALPVDAQHAYRVRFADGGEDALRRGELSIRKEYQRDGLLPDSTLDERDLAQYIIYRCVIGSRAYGLDDDSSDTDRRGVHILPLRRIVGLDPGPETIAVSERVDGLDLDLVTHDVHKFFGLLLKRNGYVLEQLTSPLVVHTTPEHAELRSLVPTLVTRHHSHHYLGFAETQWRLFEQEQPPRVKPLLYVYRVLLTGIHLMQTGAVEANLVHLNERFRLPYLPQLIARKLAGPEYGALEDADLAFHRAEYARLRAALEEAHRTSTLPEAPTGRAALDDLLIRLRLTSRASTGAA